MKCKFILIVLLLSNLILGGILIKSSLKDRIPIFHPFEINFHVSEKSLIESGYKSILEDVPLFGKQIGDTLIYYQLAYDCNIRFE